MRARNPGIVYCSISGYGQHDPRAALPGHDVNYQAWSGALTPEGGTATTVPPLPTADLAAGLTAAFGICAAVLGRITSGEGTYLDVSMTDVLATWTGPAGAGTAGGAARRSAPAPTPGYGLFATADGGQVALGVVNEQHFWANLCEELGLGRRGGPRLRRAPPARRRAPTARVAEAIATQPRDGLVARLVAAGVPVAPVLDRQGMLAATPFPGFPIRLPLPEAARPVPTLDQHRGEGFAEPG